MLYHLVSMRFTDPTTDAQIDAIARGLQALPSSIEDIRSLRCGRDVVRSDRSYDFGLLVVLEDEAALARYRDHPEHQRVLKDLIRPAVAQVVAVDFVAEG